MNIFSFRAECPYDALRFLTNVSEYAVENSLQLPGLINFKQDMGYPDVSVEFGCGVSLDNLRTVGRDIEDCHVLVQTLRQVPLDKNNLERDWSL